MSKTNCISCKCNTCGNMYCCEILMERIIDADTTNSHCDPILNCSLYTEEKDESLYRVWECELKSKIGGDKNVIRRE